MTFSAAEFDERYRNITLRLTCSACPEQYDAFIGDRKVGYLRLRWGEFRVDYGNQGTARAGCRPGSRLERIYLSRRTSSQPLADNFSQGRSIGVSENTSDSAADRG